MERKRREPWHEDIALAGWLERNGYVCPALKVAFRNWESTFAISPRRLDVEAATEPDNAQISG